MAGYPLDFSQNGEILVYSSPDGVLKLWDSSTGQLNKEYTPSSHLSATCSCLSWGPGRHLSASPKRKRRRKSGGGLDEIEDLDLIAMGTANGNILLYSVTKGEVHTQFDEGHTDSVNGICWHAEKPNLYSCSSDHHVIEWDVVTGKVKQKWKADKGSVHSVCLCSHNHLLTAGRSIKLWEIHTRQVLKSFTGHATEVFRLISVPLIDGDPTSAESSYFLSAARNDRVINAWQIDTSSRDKNALASFSLPDEPVYVHSSKSDSDQSLLLAVVTKGGQVLIFEHTLNGRLKKPLRAKVKIQVVTPGGGVKEDTPRPIPVLAAHICPGKERGLLVAHGSYLKPTFEKVLYDPSQPDVCLIREDPLRSAFKKDSSISRIKTPGVSKDATVLVPANMVPKDPSLSAEKRRKRQNSVGEMSMEERLHAISLDKTEGAGGGKGKKGPPTAESVAHLLGQALQSKDKKLLNNVLQRSNEKVIQKTVQKLPIVCVLPLVHELAKRMEGHPSSASKSVKWLKTVMTVHTSYLMTFPEIVEKLSALYQMMDARVSMFSKLSRLQGKLDLVLTQITSHHQEDEEEGAKSQQPLLLYQDESSDEDFPMEDILPSESGEDWDDLSEEMSSDGIETNGKDAVENSTQNEEEDDDDDDDEDEEEEEDEEEDMT